MGNQDFPVGRVVVYDEDSGSVDLGRRSDIAFAIGLFCEAGCEPELRADALFADEADFAAHHLGQLFGDRQPQPGAAVLARRRCIGLGELPEQEPFLVRRDADARVLHGEAEHHLRVGFPFQACSNRNLSLTGELHRVSGKVEEYLAKTAGVPGEMARHVRCRGADEFEPGLVGPRGQQDRKVVEQRPQVEVQCLQLHLAGLDLGEVEDVVEDGQQRLAARPDRLGVSPLFLVERRIEEEAGHADHAVHRGPDFVAHVGQELALRGVGRVRFGRQLDGPSHGTPQLGVGLPQPLLGFLAGGDVDERRDKVVGLAAPVADQCHVDVGPDGGAAPRDVALFEPAHSLLRDQFALRGATDGLVIGMREVIEPPAGERLG